MSATRKASAKKGRKRARPTPEVAALDSERHTISVLVDNEAGVLARVIGLFSGRGYNIESLTVAEVDEVEHLSRITVVTSGTPMIIEQIKAQLGRLVPVHSVGDLTLEGPHVERELALVKVAGSGEARVESLRIADIFRARVVDSTIAESFVFEIVGLDRQAGRLHRAHEAARPRRDRARRRGRHRARSRHHIVRDAESRIGRTKMRVYYDRDADVNLIKSKKVAVVGYGSQGPCPRQQPQGQRRVRGGGGAPRRLGERRQGAGRRP